MTFNQKIEFYKNDEQKYIVENNEEFLSWLSTTINGGYKHHHKLKSMQDLIDSITNWYEIKYPEMQLGAFEDTPFYEKFKGIKPLNNEMTSEQLLYRLPLNQYTIMDCQFYSEYNHVDSKIKSERKLIIVGKTLYDAINDYKNEGKIGHPGSLIDAHIYYSGLDYYIDTKGNVTYLRDLDEEKSYSDIEYLNADELLAILKTTGKYDLTNLENDIFNYYSDVELRHRLLQMTALNIMYSKNTNPERGYERAQLFIKEFNEELGLLLTTDEIDEIMNQATKAKQKTL